MQIIQKQCSVWRLAAAQARVDRAESSCNPFMLRCLQKTSVYTCFLICENGLTNSDFLRVKLLLHVKYKDDIWYRIRATSDVRH